MWTRPLLNSMFQGQGQLQRLTTPVLVPANAPSILAIVSSLNKFDDGWKLRASFTSNEAQRNGETSLDLMVWVP
jgi:hypothetical protein